MESLAKLSLSGVVLISLLACGGGGDSSSGSGGETSTPETTGGQRATSLSINGMDTREGRNIPFTVVLSKASSKEVTVELATVPVSARPGKDYYGTHQKLAFAPGQVKKTVTVETLENDEIDGTRLVRARLFGAKGALVSKASDTVRIIDNDGGGS